MLTLWLRRGLSLGLLALFGLVPLSGSVETVGASQYNWWDPRVSIVWAHDGHGRPVPAHESRAVNVSVWPRQRVSCAEMPTDVVLLMAKDNEPAAPVSVNPVLGRRVIGGIGFPTLEYNDLPADLLADPTSSSHFVTKTGTYLANAWTHAADPRTILPSPVTPVGYASPEITQFDARIQVVWPHDEQGRFTPVDRATLVNIAVDLFEHGSLRSVPPDYELAPEPTPGKPGPLLLYAGKNDEPMLVLPMPDYRTARLAAKVTYSVDGQVFPRRVFNDVPVEPGQQYHFAAYVSPETEWVTFPTIWMHAADARTILPNPIAPPGCTSN